MTLEFLRQVFREHAADEAILEPQRTWTFERLLGAIDDMHAHLRAEGIARGTVVSLEADFSAESIAMLLALLEADAIVVPLVPGSGPRQDLELAIAQVEVRISFDPSGSVRFAKSERRADHPLYAQLGRAGHPGLILFTSGSTGEPKAALHDCEVLLEKYKTRRHRLRTLLFLRFDHIGGFDTLMQALSNGSAVAVPEERTIEGVAAAIEQHRLEVLPASPSFLAMLLLSDLHHSRDLSSLRYITYGAEVMPATTLAKLAAEFPRVTLLQKYGLTELGTLRSHSRSNDSLWVRVGGEGFETRVIDGRLEVKAQSSMLGYLNAPSPFTADGWFPTGDEVLVEGNELRILGRSSDLINVGGRKVYPSEVESVVQEDENVAEVAVSGEAHPFAGQVVVARVVLRMPEDRAAAERRIRDRCRAVLEPYMVPVRVDVAEGSLHDRRDKKIRRSLS